MSQSRQTTNVLAKRGEHKPLLVKLYRVKTENKGVSNPTIKNAKMEAPIRNPGPKAPEKTMGARALVLVLGIAMAPKRRTKIYKTVERIVDSMITLGTLTLGFFSDSQAGVAMTRAKLMRTTPNMESRLEFK
jgi:hypothetical protein